MAEEEAALKRQLEETSNFEERREIRQKLRDIRKKKLDALESETASNERPRRRDRAKREEQTTVTTTRTKTTESDSNAADSTQPVTRGTKIEVNYSRTVISGGHSENGVENGDVEHGKCVEEETISIEDIKPVEEGAPAEIEIKTETQFSVQINGENDVQDTEEKHEEPEQEQQPTESVLDTPEKADVDEPDVAAETNDIEEVKEEEEEAEEVVLTPQVVEKMEDIEQLDKLLKEVPLNEYELRKAIRLQIRQLRVKKETNESTENAMRISRTKQERTRDLQGAERVERDATGSKIAEDNKATLVSSSPLDKLEEQADVETEKTEDSDTESVDETSSTVSSEASDLQSAHNDPRSRPARLPQPAGVQSTGSESELSGDFKTRVLGQSAALPRDLAKKGRPSGPEQVDFRANLKRTGLRADKDLTVQGKKHEKWREGKYKEQLKTTGAETSRNLSAARNVGKKVEGAAQADFRGVLNKTPGGGAGGKTAPQRPPPTYLTKKAESGVTKPAASSQATRDSSAASKEVTQRQEGTKKELGRRISSSDLFDMLHKPVETPKESYLVQRGLKKADAQKPSSAQKFITPSAHTKEDDSFKARMAQRKERSEKMFLPPKTGRKNSGDETRSDFRSALKGTAAVGSKFLSKVKESDADGQPSQKTATSDEKPEVVIPKKALPTGAVKWNERHSVDIQNKDELHKLRAELLKQREEQGKDSPGEGTKEVMTTTEKTTGIEQTDAGEAEVTTEVKKTTEVHKAGGATMTVTKTTRTTEVKGGNKGASIDALFAQKQKERMMAKKQQHADTKNKRMAFKQQLEAQSPKVEGGKKFQTGNTAIGQLQEWCRRRTKYHEGVDIQNFTTSWANGLAMCALLNYFLPEKIPFDTLEPQNKRANWELAFNVAGEEGIEPLLELEDVMAVDVPEPKSLITYVHFIYSHFAEKQQQQKQG